MSANQIIIWGGVITQDPQIKNVGNTTLLTLNVGTTKVWKDKAGQRQEKRCYHELKLWGKDAEQAAQKAVKLGQVFCRGSLEMETWQDKATGQNRQKHVIAVDFPAWENLHIFPPREFEQRDDSPQEYRQSAQKKAPAGDDYGNYDTEPPF